MNPLAFEDSVTVNTRTQISLCDADFIFFRTTPSEDFAGYIVVLLFTSLENFIFFSIEVVTVYMGSNSGQAFLFLLISASLVAPYPCDNRDMALRGVDGCLIEVSVCISLMIKYMVS